MNKKPPGPACIARTPENIARVSEALIRSPRQSARRRASELGFSREISEKHFTDRFKIPSIQNAGCSTAQRERLRAMSGLLLCECK